MLCVGGHGPKQKATMTLGLVRDIPQSIKNIPYSISTQGYFSQVSHHQTSPGTKGRSGSRTQRKGQFASWCCQNWPGRWLARDSSAEWSLHSWRLFIEMLRLNYFVSIFRTLCPIGDKWNQIKNYAHSFICRVIRFQFVRLSSSSIK